MSKLRKKYSSNSGFLFGNFVKLILLVVAIISFSLAFFYDQINQKINEIYPIGVKNENCLEQFYRGIPPYLNKESLKKYTYPLCFNNFSLMYSGISKTPLWTAEYLTKKRLTKNVQNEFQFYEEERISFSHRSKLSDYRGTGYIRWRSAPKADMPSEEAKRDSHSLANVIPVAKLEPLVQVEYLIRGMVFKTNADIYVISGPIFSNKKLIRLGSGVIVPNALFKAVYIPKTGTVGAYFIENSRLSSSKINVVSICFIEEITGVNLFPQLTEDQKRNTYTLPLSQNDLQSAKEIEYSFWDSESQCEADVSKEDIKQLQEDF